MEEARALPLGAVWDHYCQTRGIPTGPEAISAVHAYEAAVTSKR